MEYSLQIKSKENLDSFMEYFDAKDISQSNLQKLSWNIRVERKN